MDVVNILNNVNKIILSEILSALRLLASWLTKTVEMQASFFLVEDLVYLKILKVHAAAILPVIFTHTRPDSNLLE